MNFMSRELMKWNGLLVCSLSLSHLSHCIGCSFRATQWLNLHKYQRCDYIQDFSITRYYYIILRHCIFIVILNLINLLERIIKMNIYYIAK